jgi:LacI family transcriptional regulator, repressor for deo operon, udp, cdd, tsx, nupC, and nupG
MTTSIKDIAKAAGVSHTTVSRALRDSPEIGESTKQRIRNLSERMGYRPSAAARSLVTHRTHTIGVVITSLADPFHTDVVQGIERSAQEYRYSILLTMSHEDPARERAVAETLIEKRVDGLIVAASRLGDYYLSFFQLHPIPIVLLNTHHRGEHIYSVATDNRAAGYEAGRYLIGLGHRRLGYIGNTLGGQTDRERLAGLRRAVREAGPGSAVERAPRGNGRVEGGLEAMRQVLKLRQPPTALFCYNDLTAIGALKAILEAGKRVPDDFSLVGMDGLVEATYVSPPLTTIEQPRQQMGHLAFEVLMDVLNERRAPERIVITGKLIERGSCRVRSPRRTSPRNAPHTAVAV